MTIDILQVLTNAQRSNDCALNALLQQRSLWCCGLRIRNFGQRQTSSFHSAGCPRNFKHDSIRPSTCLDAAAAPS